MSAKAKSIWIALGLIGLALCSQIKVYGDMPVPPEVPPTVRTQTWFFAATAYSADGLESDYSTEVVYSSTNYGQVTLAWDASDPATNVAGYRAYMGRCSRAYTNVTEAGTNLQATVPLRKALLTNRVVTVRALVGTNAAGPWRAFANWPAVSATNPAGNQFYRLDVSEVAQ